MERTREDIERLAAVQELDLKIAKLHRELRDIPARKKEIDSRNDKYREALEAAKDTLTARQAAAKERELEAQAERDKIQKLRTQQLDLKTNKEFKAMEDEIAGLERKISGIEDDELQLMEDIDGAKQGVTEAESALKRGEDEAGARAAEMDTRKQALEQEVRDLEERRQAQAEQVVPDWLKHYEKIMDNRGDVALAKVEHGICSGCHMKVPPALMHEASKGTTLPMCSNCGRLLY